MRTKTITDTQPIMDQRPVVYVHNDYSPDDVRIFYEVPEAIARRIQPANDRRTFAKCLADMLEV